MTELCKPLIGPGLDKTQNRRKRGKRGGKGEPGDDLEYNGGKEKIRVTASEEGRREVFGLWGARSDIVLVRSIAS